ncbi:hypothetical protein RhiJN_23760 [Ceratobasidium sp. AG-Ba]|nr:hypothetical protein RhiJN_23760 [Ceratobasidium sp. AG-Ba]
MCDQRELNEPPLDKPDRRPRSLTLGRSSDLTHSAYGNERSRTPHCNTSPLSQRASRASDPSSRGNLESPLRRAINVPAPPCSHAAVPPPLPCLFPRRHHYHSQTRRNLIAQHFAIPATPCPTPPHLLHQRGLKILATSHRQPEIHRQPHAKLPARQNNPCLAPVPRSSGPLEGVAGATAKKAKEPRAVGTIMISVPSRWSERLNANHE